MINKKQYDAYVEASRNPDDNFVCFFCKQLGTKKDLPAYGICRLPTSELDDIQLIAFHEKCFRTIAGETYIFDF